MKTQLYRHFSSDGVLLYVGISLSAVNRLAQHRDKPWIHDIARVEVECFATREEALHAEQQAIQAENPKWNVLGRDGPARRRNGRRVTHSQLETLEGIADELRKVYRKMVVGTISAKDGARQANILQTLALEKSRHQKGDLERRIGVLESLGS